MSRLATIAAFLAALTALGCNTYEHRIDEPDPFDGGADSDADSDTDVDSDTDSDTGTGSDTGSGGDTGTISDWCTAVDILFVVQQDALSPFGSFHDDLADAVPGFVGGLWDLLPPDTSIHAGLTTGDFSDQVLCSSSYVNCYPDADAGTLDAIPDHYTTPDVLETSENGGQGRLYVHDGQPYYEADVSDSLDETELALWLMAAIEAQAVNGCTYLMYAAAAGWSAHPVNADSNAGFLRDEGAVLLIVFAGGLPDVSPDPYEDLKAMIAAEKASCGVDECTITAGLVWSPCLETSIPYSPAVFLQMFGDEPLLGDVGEPGDHPLVLGEDLAQQVAATCEAIGPD